MSNDCLSYQNLATKSCKDIMAVTRRVIIVPLYAADGTKNYISASNALLKSGWAAKFDNLDATKRFYPCPEMDNVSDVREETVFETLDSGRKVRIRQGIRTFMGYPIQEGAEWLGNIQKWQKKGNKFGVYLVDKDANLVYNYCSDGNLYPFPVASGSFDALFMKPDNKASEKIKIQWDYDVDNQDSDMRMIAASDFTDINLLTDAYALLTVTATVASISTTGFTATLKDMYGYPVTGLLSANFALYNNTTSSSVTIATCTETSSGVYHITYTSQTSGNVLKLTPTESGFDFTSVPNVTITIP